MSKKNDLARRKRQHEFELQREKKEKEKKAKKLHAKKNNMKNDVDLIHEIEAVVGKQLEEFACKEQEVLSDITRVYKARRVATMKLMDDGFEEKVKERKKQKLKTLAEKGLLKKTQQL